MLGWLARGAVGERAMCTLSGFLALPAPSLCIEGECRFLPISAGLPLTGQSGPHVTVCVLVGGSGTGLGADIQKGLHSMEMGTFFKNLF